MTATGIAFGVRTLLKIALKMTESRRHSEHFDCHSPDSSAFVYVINDLTYLLYFGVLDHLGDRSNRFAKSSSFLGKSVEV